MAVLRGDAFRVELHAMDLVCLMLQSHDHAIFGFSRNLETVGQAVSLDGERVIARSLECIRQTFEKAFPRASDGGEFSVHQNRRANDAPAIGLSDGLMTEAYAHKRDIATNALDQFEANTGLIRVTRPGRHDNALRPVAQNLVYRHLIVAVDTTVSAELAQKMDEIVSETVVIIDEYQHSAEVSRLRACRQVG